MTLTSTARKPWSVERHDQEDGSITYEVWDYNPDSYRRVCKLNDDEINEGRNAKRDAYTIAAGSASSPGTADIPEGEPVAWRVRVNESGRIWYVYTERLPYTPDVHIKVLSEPEPLYASPSPNEAKP